MDEQRRERLHKLIAADAQNSAGAPRVGLICARCVSELALTGAGATVLSHPDNRIEREPNRGLVHASNQVSAGLEELQMTVGEGPCLDAFNAGGPVLIADLSTERRWPVFTGEAIKLGAAAVFSFPLSIGVVRLGSLDCYRDTAGPLTPTQLTDALVLTELATHAVIAELDGHDPADVSWLADAHLELHQAAGMVQVQIGMSTETALMRLRGYAYVHQQSLTEVARRVVDRELRFTPEGTEG